MIVVYSEKIAYHHQALYVPNCSAMGIPLILAISIWAVDTIYTGV